MRRKASLGKYYFLGFFILVLSAVLTAVTAANIVPVTSMDDQQSTISANNKKPSVCASIFLSNVISGSGNFHGDNNSNLITGSAGNDNIDARNGDDCILGGNGDDHIDGRNGYDICIGGGGNDTFIRCEEIID